MTQSYPTNFHQFYKCKVLTENDSIDDFMEVTAAKKASLEKSDAAFAVPSEDLIARAKAGTANYNYDTGFFELNGLTDITVQQMEAILLEGKHTTLDGCSPFIRTNLPITSKSALTSVNVWSSLGTNSVVEVINLKTYPNIEMSSCSLCVNVSNVKRIIGIIVTKGNLGGFSLNVATKLEDIQLKGIANSFSWLSACKSLSLDSIAFMVTNAANTSPITITVHPDIYAKLTDETNAEWHQTLLDAAEKDITFTTT